MTDISFPDKKKVKQFIIQFAFRIPTRKELTGSEKKVLENTLREVNPQYFQLLQEAAGPSPGTLFQFVHQIPVGPGTIMIPSFVLSNNSFSFIWPVRMGDQWIPDFHSFDTRDMNRKISGWVVTVQNAITNSGCQRTGKIYEMVLGPFPEADKANLFQALFSMSLGDVGEVSLAFTKYIKSDGSVHNIQTNINYMQQKLEDTFYIRIRVDINNRDLAPSMDPGPMAKVWNFADDAIGSHLSGLLRME